MNLMGRLTTRHPGVSSAVLAYSIWGMLPLYFIHLSEPGYADIFQHRIIWSALLLGLFLLAKGQIRGALQLLLAPRTLAGVAASGILIGSNWLIYAYAVLHGQTLEASLAYFINPLLTAFMARIFFSERLARYHLIAFAFGACGVLWQIFFLGRFPWIAILLAGTFAIYGITKKFNPIPPVQGLWLETLILLPTLGVLKLTPFWNAHPIFMYLDKPVTMALLVGLGITTTFPLILFTQAARQLSLVAMAILQYLSPSLKFVVALAFLGEVLTMKKLISYGFVWIGVAIFIAGTISSRKPKKETR